VSGLFALAGYTRTRNILSLGLAVKAEFEKSRTFAPDYYKIIKYEAQLVT
jgi:hypothetical protein